MDIIGHFTDIFKADHHVTNAMAQETARPRGQCQGRAEVKQDGWMSLFQPTGQSQGTQLWIRREFKLGMSEKLDLSGCVVYCSVPLLLLSSNCV